MHLIRIFFHLKEHFNDLGITNFENIYLYFEMFKYNNLKLNTNSNFKDLKNNAIDHNNLITNYIHMNSV